ncbi:MGMT family protein [Ktedonospora formicarum]|uniref:Methylated-DNA-[protein]-cysteine S-methyltransferase DNA binding domain-containing protein n=1 Tax=Ktedonospora formicarum TaxID=2778364 RepID=A0A8J3MQP1_9CHLR|nr:MGMT family protein [Ktedonospora formicarum]GHO42808.1 hypothetical protein KSX_09710 [Ktedonospora formicarum]
MQQESSSTPKPVAIIKAQVFALVNACPAGRVTTYGWIGKALGYPRGARMIGWIMNDAHGDVPAQRVVNSKGELSGSWAFGQKGRMRQLLEAEGVELLSEERVDIKRYGWDPSRDLDPNELRHIIETTSPDMSGSSKRLLFLLQNDPASPLREELRGTEE